MGRHDSRQPVRRVLIIRPSALGDVARTVPALVTLRKALPHAHIDWLVQHTFADVVRHHPMLDGVVPFYRNWGRAAAPHKSLTQATGFVRRLRRGRYDVVYDLQGLARSGLFTRLTGAPRRVGFADARELGWLGYNVRHQVPADRKHAVDRMLGLLEADGLEPVDDMRLYVGEDDQRWFDHLKREHDIEAGRYACVAPTARWGSKCWPLDRYAEVTRRLLTNPMAGGKVIILASPNERPHVETMLASLHDLADQLVFPTTTVGQMMAILSDARLLVCNDSAPLHIAVGFDRPIVAIFGPTDPATVGPYQRGDSVIRPPTASDTPVNYRDLNDQSLIAQIDVETVWSRIQQTLQPTPAPTPTPSRP